MRREQRLEKLLKVLQLQRVEAELHQGHVARTGLAEDLERPRRRLEHCIEGGFERFHGDLAIATRLLRGFSRSWGHGRLGATKSVAYEDTVATIGRVFRPVIGKHARHDRTRTEVEPETHVGARRHVRRVLGVAVLVSARSGHEFAAARHGDHLVRLVVQLGQLQRVLSQGMAEAQLVRRRVRRHGEQLHNGAVFTA